MSKHVEKVEIPRKVLYGKNAIEKLPKILKELKIKNITICSGKTATKEIVEKRIEPLISENLDNSNEWDVLVLSGDVSELPDLATRLGNHKTTILAVGGGSVLDQAKILSSLSNHPYIAVPTNASHDGFASPYIGFLLRCQLETHIKRGNFPRYTPVSPLAIVGDTMLIAQAPFKYLAAGVGDLLAKYVAIKDWEMAHRIKGEEFDIYAATFGLMTAKLVERNMDLIAKDRGERGVRVVVKAHASSGVAMSIAGNSRPASGSEHLISHALDLLSLTHETFKGSSHGFQAGLASIVMMYFHGGDWEKQKNLLKKVGVPTTLKEINIDRDVFHEAMKLGPTIRERYTILSTGITRKALDDALDATGVD